jgi:plasmid stabilization system protein ParE
LAEARAELLEARGWYRDKSEHLALDFDRAIAGALDVLGNNPCAGALWLGRPRRPQIRRWVMDRYPYSILYRLVDDRIVVLAVSHAKRKPGYWRDRVLGG